MVEIDELNCLQIAILVQVAMFVLDQEILKFAIFFVPKFSQICKQHITAPVERTLKNNLSQNFGG